MEIYRHTKSFDKLPVKSLFFLAALLKRKVLLFIQQEKRNNFGLKNLTIKKINIAFANRDRFVYWSVVHHFRQPFYTSKL